MINININMVAERRAKHLREMTVIRVSILSVLAVSIIMVLTNLIASYTYMQAKQDIASINDRLKQQQIEYKQWSVVQDDIKEMTPVVELLEKVQLSEGAWMTILGDLSQITTKDVVISSLSSGTSPDGFILRLSGRATDERALADFMLRLRENTGWVDVPKLIVTSVEENNIESLSASRFDLDIPVKGLIGGDI